VKNFQLEIVTPTNTFSEEKISYLRCPGLDGLFGVMAEHTDAVIAVSLGEIKVEKDSSVEYYATSGGFAEISGSSVHLLLETAERSKDIDIERAKKSAERAKERLSLDREIDFARARGSLDKAVNRIRISSL